MARPAAQLSAEPPAGDRALSLVALETRARCLFLNSFHTFPEENSVVKVQTLIEKVVAE